jgi:hypothetical protein
MFFTYFVGHLSVFSIPIIENEDLTRWKFLRLYGSTREQSKVLPHSTGFLCINYRVYVGIHDDELFL